MDKHDVDPEVINQQAEELKQIQKMMARTNLAIKRAKQKRIDKDINDAAYDRHFSTVQRLARERAGKK